MLKQFYKNQEFVVSNKAFTVIELIVVIIIVGVLTSVALPSLYNMIESHRARQAADLLRSLYMSYKDYQLDHDGQYPVTLDDMAVTMSHTVQGFGYLECFEPNYANVICAIDRQVPDWSYYQIAIDLDGRVSCRNFTQHYDCQKFGFECTVDTLGPACFDP